jgi:hypothetical protein
MHWRIGRVIQAGITHCPCGERKSESSRHKNNKDANAFLDPATKKRLRGIREQIGE